MEYPPKHVGPTTILVTRAALALLLIAVVVGQIAVFITAQSLASTYPEFANLQVPLVTAGVIFGVCVQVILVITGILVGYIQDGRIFGSSSLRLVDIMAGTLAVATVIVVSTLFLIPGPPALGLLLLGSALVGATFTLLLLVLRSLLHRAAFMRVELDEVV
ncbi:DUF2975 domain-containing protein [Arthrobacter flavus]|uniref:DUF2975 domain-containing protein n=1 Tax=Arthrobacter flavus TaxID=95172 RepID=A0ABW4Q9T1_9MICC